VKRITFLNRFFFPDHSATSQFHLTFHLAQSGQKTGMDRGSNQPLVSIDRRYFRPTEVEQLLGNPAKAKKSVAGATTLASSSRSPR
jgi:GDP-D-mannose dehydratase